MEEKRFTLLAGDADHDDFKEIGQYGGFKEAIDVAGKLVDEGSDDEFKVLEDGGFSRLFYPHQFLKRECPVCGKEVRNMDMQMTRDCHGIPFRTVCPVCYQDAMSRGYDGEYYDEADECLDYDY